MAIDGINIIDSDMAHDIYSAVTEAWKDGKSLADIMSEVRAWEKDYCRDLLGSEIYWTSLAFSLWKIGELQEEVRLHALQLISQGACKDWLDIDSEAQKKRQKALDVFAAKIILDNPRPLRRPTLPKKLRVSHFSVGDVLAVNLPNNEYGACVLVQLEHSVRKTEYHFALVNLKQSSVPTLEDVGNAEMSGRPLIGFETSCWIDHKNLTRVIPYLRRIGNVELTTYYMCGRHPVMSADDFFDCWNSESIRQGCCLTWEFINKILP
ncbi:hypothetical protein D8682_26335 [Buttiauxella sp. 3AFRM03]|uniref:hypothetical protein n=1 Tax=Buttiauxella sp. 3AFRM03 TaxID=2479367 RepID=UPI000EF7E438|nr:hypothetical protein [Buttiauxella sp. 3AFRM03]AYN30188.1 hypothetical protein D8682_26335 [Buttiauxella sp. 3AFRM03]